jgi:hypothetical protein
MSLTEQTPHPEALTSESKEVYLVSEYPQPTNNDAQQEKPARQDVDVLLDVSELEVDRINLTLRNLRAYVSVLAELASLLSLQVGVDARLADAQDTPSRRFWTNWETKPKAKGSLVEVWRRFRLPPPQRMNHQDAHLTTTVEDSP